MSGELEGDPQARLVDIVVEEVSLVDRAANKRRFLVVKREVGGGRMEGGTKPADATHGTPTEGDETSSSSPADGSQPNASTPDTLESAIGAMQGLCEATLALSEQARSEADVARVIALAGQIESLAGSLTQGAPSAPGSATATPDANAEPAEEPTDKGTEAPPPTLDGAFADVERLLGDARALVAKVVPKAAGAPPAPSPPAPPASAATPPAPAKDTPPEPTLRSVMDAIAGLTKAFQTQGDRIGKLEKGVGAPNSQPVNERPRGSADDAEVSWPMDLNVRVDRAGVDKRVSFHDD